MNGLRFGSICECVHTQSLVRVCACVQGHWQKSVKENERLRALSLLILPVFGPSLMIEGLRGKGEILIPKLKHV